MATAIIISVAMFAGYQIRKMVEGKNVQGRG